MHPFYPVFVLSFMAVATCLTRNVTHSINPGCSPSLCNNSDVDHVVNLVHLKAAGSEDSIHALWSTVGAPSALIARTEKDVNLTIDWERFVGVSYGQGSTVDPIVQFSSAPSVVFGFILRRLVEYDDKDDVADPDHYRLQNKTSSTSRKLFPLDLVDWAPVEIKGNNTFVFQSASTDPDFGDSLRLEVRMSGNMSRGASLPRLQLTPNNTHLDVFLDNKTTLFPHSRFFLVADVVNDEYPLLLTRKSTIDDEYTPGVFTTFRFGAADTKDAEKGRYAAWKPVAYTTPERSLEMETLVKAFDAAEVDSAVDVKSIVSAYYGRIGKGDDSRQIKIGFGQQGDKFYKKTNFCVWSVLVGIGHPPQDEISALVIVVISIGLGVPALFVILGGIYAGLKDRRARESSSSPRRPSGVRAPLVEEEHETYGAIGT